MGTAAATTLASLGPGRPTSTHPLAREACSSSTRRAALPRRRDPDRLLLHRAPGRAIRSSSARRCSSCGCAGTSHHLPARAPTGRPRGSWPTRRSARTPPAPSPCTDIRHSRRPARQPAFTCPCHYSTFAPGEGGKLLFGPAGRALPQLPVMIDAQGYLRAAGPFHEDIGPSWWHVTARSHGGRRPQAAPAGRARRSGRASSGSARPRGSGWLLRYVFPDHWSFLLGEIALYSFIVLVGTGIFLTLYYIAERRAGHLPGPYTLLPGAADVRGLPLRAQPQRQVPAGLLMRQAHHWAADMFIAAIVLHLMRDLLHRGLPQAARFQLEHRADDADARNAGGFRRPYSLVDDLLSGMGLAIAYADLRALDPRWSALHWGIFISAGRFPKLALISYRNLEIVHVFLIPAALFATLIADPSGADHVRQPQCHLPGPGRRERNIMGTPMWPADRRCIRSACCGR